MIIVCPECNTRFMLSASAIGEDGRDVRCAKCGHEWHAPPPRNAPEPLDLVDTLDDHPHETHQAPQSEAYEEPQEFHEDIHEEVRETPQEPYPVESELFLADEPVVHFNVPITQDKPLAAHAMWKVAAACLLLCSALLLGLVMRESLQPALAPIFSAMGYYPEKGVVLADVALRELPSRSKKRYEIECNIWNKSDQPRIIPQLSMKLINEGGEVLAEDANFLENTGQPIGKGKVIPCKGLRFENPFSTAHLLVIDMGSPLELALRSQWDYPEEESEEEEKEND